MVPGPAANGRSGVAGVVGKAAFFLFLYLEVLDASFSFDGVIGAFAITSNILIIAAGLGIGAMYVRSLTVYLVRKGTLSEYVYLEHGAHWAIGSLAVVLLLTIKYPRQRGGHRADRGRVHRPRVRQFGHAEPSTGGTGRRWGGQPDGFHRRVQAIGRE